ncbi:MAG: hypothetical protein WA945_08610 [Arcobacteraceae bacterium]
MKSMIALERIIKDLEVRISISKGQLTKHHSGEKKLSLLAESSAENCIEENIPLLDKYRKILKNLEKFEKIDSYEHRRLRAAIERKKYYKYNKIKRNMKNKKHKFRENDERIEAAMIIDELPEEILLEKRELFEMSCKNMEQYLIFDDSELELVAIQEKFNSLIVSFSDENIKSLELLNYMIPIVIFHLHIFLKNIIEQNKEDELSAEIDETTFFPHYHDWWIQELWESHIAYFSLIKWKNQVSNNCILEEHKSAWEVIFNNWIFVKTLLNEKSDLAFEYQYIVDNLIKEYVSLESELDEKIVEAEKSAMQSFIKKEDILALSTKHQLLTSYIKYKSLNKRNP